MTFSLAAFCPRSGMLGVAVTTKFLAVGSLAPFAQSGVGAIATQAFVNPTFGPRGLRLLHEGLTAEETLQVLLRSDPGREHRQVGIVDRWGNVAAFTGKETVDWAGHRTGTHFTAQGNMLVGQRVVDAVADTFMATAELDLPERLMQAIEAGQAAGGDKRGRQSAAILVVSTEEYAHINFRVDDHPDPVVELRRIFEEAKKEYLVFQQFLPTRANPAGIPEREKINAMLEAQQRNDAARRRSE